MAKKNKFMATLSKINPFKPKEIDDEICSMLDEETEFDRRIKEKNLQVEKIGGGYYVTVDSHALGKDIGYAEKAPARKHVKKSAPIVG
jgi:hypothetical protein